MNKKLSKYYYNSLDILLGSMDSDDVFNLSPYQQER